MTLVVSWLGGVSRVCRPACTGSTRLHGQVLSPIDGLPASGVVHARRARPRALGSLAHFVGLSDMLRVRLAALLPWTV